MTNPNLNTDGRAASLNASAAHDAGLYDPARHDNQIVAVFHDHPAAEQAARMLREAGVPAGAVQVIEGTAGDAAPGASRAEDRNQQVGIWGLVKSLFAPEHEFSDYHDALGRGHAMVVVHPTAETDRHRVIGVLEAAGPIDFDAKLAEWRQAAYDASGAARQSSATSGAPAGGSAYELHSRENPAPHTGAVRLDEERVRAGWREDSGAARVRSYVADRGVPEGEVRLHEERIGGAGSKDPV